MGVLANDWEDYKNTMNKFDKQRLGYDSIYEFPCQCSSDEEQVRRIRPMILDPEHYPEDKIRLRWEHRIAQLECALSAERSARLDAEAVARLERRWRDSVRPILAKVVEMAGFNLCPEPHKWTPAEIRAERERMEAERANK